MALSGFLRESLLLLAFVSWTKAQVPGTDACTCSPTTFSFTLNLLGTCPGDVMQSDSIERTSCVISDRDFMPVSPKIPVTVTSIVILEFGLALTELSQTTIRGPLQDGDSFEFPSIIAGEVLEDNDAIRILQIAVNGVNENQAPIRNSLGVVYTNACGVQPIFTIGDSIGWIVFSDFTNPLAELCEASPTAPPVPGPPTISPDTDLCSCSPLMFTFRFNFSGNCPGNVEPDDAIETVECKVENDFGEQVRDLVPVEVSFISIEEVTESGTVIEEKIQNRVFVDGETFKYTSASQDGVTPTELKIRVLGFNDIGVAVMNEILIRYTNECDQPVTFEPDAEIGWLLVEGISPATAATCQGATSPPTSTPTLSPVTPSPTVTPTPAPVSPTPAPVNPTLAPFTPTPAPVSPTPAPVNPTPAPVNLTQAPTTPTPAPVNPTPVPITPTPAPVNPTPAPITPTPAPVALTPSPANPNPVPITPAPVTPTPAPASPTPASLVSTRAPVAPPPTKLPTLTPARPRPSPEPTPDETMSFNFRHLQALLKNENKIEFGRFQDNKGNVRKKSRL